MASEKTFKMKVKSPIEHNGDRYEVGETIELTQAEAEAMPWALEWDVPFKLPKKTSVTGRVGDETTKSAEAAGSQFNQTSSTATT